jgi:hypothetical protein
MGATSFVKVGVATAGPAAALEIAKTVNPRISSATRAERFMEPRLSPAIIANFAYLPQPIRVRCDQIGLDG